MAAGNAGLERQIVPDIQARDQVELLKYQAEPVTPQCRPPGVGEIGQQCIGQLNLTAVGPVQPCDQMEQRTLAAAGFSGQRDALAGRDT